MTKQEKERKLSILRALMIVKHVQLIKEKPETALDAISQSLDIVNLLRRYKVLQRTPIMRPQPTFNKGGIIYDRSNEVVVTKSGKVIIPKNRP